MSIKVNDSKDPVAEQDSLLVQVDYANQPIPNNRLPKGLYYSFKDKWVDMITLLTPAIKKIVTANTTVPAWGSITGTLSNQTDLQSALDNKMSSDLTDSHIFVGDATNKATDVAMTGDVTIDNTGRNDVRQLYEGLQKVNERLFEVQFANMDFRQFLKSVSIEKTETEKTLIYCDPPYLDTDDNYSHSFNDDNYSHSFKEQDAADLFDCLIETGCKFAYSEFDHPFILEQAEKRGLNVIRIVFRSFTLYAQPPLQIQPLQREHTVIQPMYVEKERQSRKEEMNRGGFKES